MTTETTPTIQELAREASGYFERARRATGDTETGPREDGDPYVRLTESAPEWVRELVYDAHGEMLPDDWRYAAIWAALDAIEEADDPDDACAEFADGYVDVYTAALLAWVASHGSRVAYCDEGADELGGGEDVDTVKRMQLGQYMEASEVYGLVLQSLEQRQSAIELDELTEEVA